MYFRNLQALQFRLTIVSGLIGPDKIMTENVI